MKDVQMKDVEITGRVRAIIQFGPATPVSGCRAGEYYQCTIDPNMVSPGGEFIRFDTVIQGGEVNGWQRIEALTVCEILGDAPEYKDAPPGYVIEENAKVVMRALA
jgi:hypothetical protein